MGRGFSFGVMTTFWNYTGLMTTQHCGRTKRHALFTLKRLIFHEFHLNKVAAASHEEERNVIIRW
jgi:hypothetical protein